MGRKNRHTLIQNLKGGAKAGEGSSKTTLNKTKKAKNVFKVNTKKKDKAKKAASNVQKGKGGKKEAIQKKSEKLNETLKTLHKDMVVKKKAAPAKASPAKGRRGAKKATKTKDVEAGISKLDV
uniref:Putative trna n=1 Tax=Nyssomyia neivai TaxID=330878 RepID=A0A1L8DBQ5_9DIPT